MPLISNPKQMQRFLIIIGILFCFGSCKKDKNSPALLFISPASGYINAVPAQVVIFTVNGSSEAIPLSNFIIRTKIPLSGYTVLVDTALSNKSFSMQYEYLVPSFSQSTSIQVEFILNDRDGNETKVARSINVSIQAVNGLTETTGHEMYSAVSGKEDAYNLVAGTPLFSQSAPLSNQHIRDSTINDSLGTYLLSNKWFSPAGLKFVRFVDFDYANATYTSLKQSYEAGIQKSFISNITAGDIILMHLPASDPDSGYAAIKLVYVIDTDSSDFDRYIFNIKK